jgi:hypothetical protein
MVHIRALAARKDREFLKMAKSENPLLKQALKQALQ